MNIFNTSIKCLFKEGSELGEVCLTTVVTSSYKVRTGGVPGM